MRTTPLVGQKAWFGPRRFGWGLGPASPEGWAVVAVAAVAVIVVAMLDKHFWWVALLVVLGLITVSFLKGTSPGGPLKWEEFRAARDSGNLPPAGPGVDPR